MISRNTLFLDALPATRLFDSVLLVPFTTSAHEADATLCRVTGTFALVWLLERTFTRLSDCLLSPTAIMLFIHFPSFFPEVLHFKT